MWCIPQQANCNMAVFSDEWRIPQQANCSSIDRSGVVRFASSLLETVAMVVEESQLAHECDVHGLVYAHKLQIVGIIIMTPQLLRGWAM